MVVWWTSLGYLLTLPGGGRLSIRLPCPNRKLCLNLFTEVRTSRVHSSVSQQLCRDFAFRLRVRSMTSETRGFKKLFTVDQANNMLPLVRAIVADLQRLYVD